MRRHAEGEYFLQNSEKVTNHRVTETTKEIFHEKFENNYKIDIKTLFFLLNF